MDSFTPAAEFLVLATFYFFLAYRNQGELHLAYTLLI